MFKELGIQRAKLRTNEEDNKCKNAGEEESLSLSLTGLFSSSHFLSLSVLKSPLFLFLFILNLVLSF